MTETQERFLRAVAERVPLERVAEVYLFPAIRQGGVETGLAVVAAEPEPAPGPGPAAVVAEAVAPADQAQVPNEQGPAVGDVPASLAAGTAGPADVVAPMSADQQHGGDRSDGAEPVEGASAAPHAGGPPQQHDGLADVVEHHRNAASGVGSPRVADERPPAADEPPARHTIFSARYRLALKGPDRGKWEVDVVAEADAPLVTVDAVVRGIRKRTGEAADAERVPREVLRELTAQPA